MGGWSQLLSYGHFHTVKLVASENMIDETQQMFNLCIFIELHYRKFPSVQNTVRVALLNL